ncbi:MAG: vWA domain-containing protein [Acidimicrobiales bacterium]
MIDILSGFVEQLRAAGVAVGITEHVDAMRAVDAVSLHERAIVRWALGSTLAKSRAEWVTFETVFDAYFSVESQDRDADDAFGRRVERVVAHGDGAVLRSAAREAVRRHAALGTPPGGVHYHLFRTLRRIDFATLPERALAVVSATKAGGGHEAAGLTPLEAHLARRTVALRTEQLRDEVESEIRRRMAFTDRDHAPAGLMATQLEIRRASAGELDQIRAAIQPLARRLAARLTKSRRAAPGRLDFRHTIRRSLAYGGVPLEPVIRGRRRSLPEIMALADVSRSVADFSRFTLQLVYALSSQFSEVRSFVFVDAIEEVSEQLRDRAGMAEAMRALGTGAGITRFDGHSDYGHAFTDFWRRWGAEVTPRTTLVVLGDARNNYHASQSWVLGELRRRARRVYWLNPEPVSSWDMGDSLMSEYAASTHDTFECRNLDQLEQFVERCC